MHRGIDQVSKHIKDSGSHVSNDWKRSYKHKGDVLLPKSMKMVDGSLRVLSLSRPNEKNWQKLSEATSSEL